MRVWSAAFFIPEMLAFQQVPLDAPASADLVARVRAWTTWTWWREPLDVLSFAAFVAALLRASSHGAVSLKERRPAA
jgi:hypothetical protein